MPPRETPHPPLVSAAGRVSICTERFWRLPDGKHPNCSRASALFFLAIARSRLSSLLEFSVPATRTLPWHRTPGTESSRSTEHTNERREHGRPARPGHAPAPGEKRRSPAGSSPRRASQGAAIPARVCKTDLLSADSRHRSIPESSLERDPQTLHPWESGKE